MDYSKKAAKIRKQRKIDLKHKLKNLESNLCSEENLFYLRKFEETL